MIAFDAKLRAEMSSFFLSFFFQLAQQQKNTFCGSNIQSSYVLFFFSRERRKHKANRCMCALLLLLEANRSGRPYRVRLKY